MTPLVSGSGIFYYILPFTIIKLKYLLCYGLNFTIENHDNNFRNVCVTQDIDIDVKNKLNRDVITCFESSLIKDLSSSSKAFQDFCSQHA